MANTTPVGRRPRQERTDNLYDAGLELVAEQREISVKRMAKLRLISTLEEADQIERERARHRVARAQACLREAQDELRDATDDADRLDDISGARSAAWKEVLEFEEEDERTIDEAERQFVVNGKAAGAAYIHPDLMAPKGMVDAQKHRRIDRTNVSPSEAQTL